MSWTSCSVFLRDSQSALLTCSWPPHPKQRGNHGIKLVSNSITRYTIFSVNLEKPHRKHPSIQWDHDNWISWHHIGLCVDVGVYGARLLLNELCVMFSHFITKPVSNGGTNMICQCQRVREQGKSCSLPYVWKNELRRSAVHFMEMVSWPQGWCWIRFYCRWVQTKEDVAMGFSVQQASENPWRLSVNGPAMWAEPSHCCRRDRDLCCPTALVYRETLRWENSGDESVFIFPVFTGKLRQLYSN